MHGYFDESACMYVEIGEYRCMQASLDIEYVYMSANLCEDACMHAYLVDICMHVCKYR
jgi:hypothetical protein